MDLFEKAETRRSEKHLPSVEIFARKKGRALKRYGTKRPNEKVNTKDLLVAWREDL